jgi:hypothetical protein
VGAQQADEFGRDGDGAGLVVGAVLEAAFLACGAVVGPGRADGPGTSYRAWRARSKGIRVTAIWGTSLKDNEVGAAIYEDCLPAALEKGELPAGPGAALGYQ